MGQEELVISALYQFDIRSLEDNIDNVFAWFQPSIQRMKDYETKLRDLAASKGVFQSFSMKKHIAKFGKEFSVSLKNCISGIWSPYYRRNIFIVDENVKKGLKRCSNVLFDEIRYEIAAGPVKDTKLFNLRKIASMAPKN